MMVEKLITKKKTSINYPIVLREICVSLMIISMRYAQQYNREIDDFEDIGRPHVHNYA